MHLQVLLIKRILSFVLSIVKGKHEMCKTLLYLCSSNVMSVTGSNLKNIEIEAHERIQLEELHVSIVRVGEILEFGGFLQ